MTLHTMPGHLIRRLHQISTAIFADRVKAAGADMTSVQYAALKTVQDSPGIDQATLAQQIAYDRATIGGVVDRLEKKGWIKREVNSQDRRARQLCLTDQGIAVLVAVSPVIETLQAEILGPLTPEERRVFIALAHKTVGQPAGFAPPL